MLRIKVSATSANFCVGFDVCGIAVNIYNEFTFEKSNEFEFIGFLDKYKSKNTNLLYQAYEYVFKYLNKEIIPVKMSIKEGIPISRGLGSSSSLIVAGVLAANELLNKPLSKEECLNLSAQIEGHPDNVAPAIYGSFTTCYKINDCYYHNIYKINPNLKFMVIIPNKTISTHEARNVLPKEYSINDCVNNLSRIINIPRALENGDLNLLRNLFIDKIHEPYRCKLIPNYYEIKNICDNNNSILAISGSGSTMLIISDSYDIINKLKNFNSEIRKVEIDDGVKIYYE